MKCPNCGNEIDNNSKFCPNCGTEISISDMQKSNAKFTIKNVIISIIAIILLCSGCNDLMTVFNGIGVISNINENNSKAVLEQDNWQDLSIDEMKQIMDEADNEYAESENRNKDNIEYTSILYSSLMDQIEGNPLAAQNELIGNYYKIKVKIRDIDSDGDMIFENPSYEADELVFSDNVNSNALEKILKYKENDTVWIYGKITKVDENAITGNTYIKIDIYDIDSK